MMSPAEKLRFDKREQEKIALNIKEWYVLFCLFCVFLIPFFAARSSSEPA